MPVMIRDKCTISQTLCVSRYGAHVADWAQDGTLYAFAARNAIVLMEPAARACIAVLAAHANRCPLSCIAARAFETLVGGLSQLLGPLQGNGSCISALRHRRVCLLDSSASLTAAWTGTG